MPEEIRLRLLLRAIDRFGHEGPAELGKVEALLAALDQAVAKTAEARQPQAETDPCRRLVSLVERPDSRSNRRRPAAGGRQIEIEWHEAADSVKACPMRSRP